MYTIFMQLRPCMRNNITCYLHISQLMQKEHLWVEEHVAIIKKRYEHQMCVTIYPPILPSDLLQLEDRRWVQPKDNLNNDASGPNISFSLLWVVNISFLSCILDLLLNVMHFPLFKKRDNILLAWNLADLLEWAEDIFTFLSVKCPT